MTVHGVTLDALLDAATALVKEPLDVQPCALDDAAGRTLAQPLLADRDHPPFNRAAMDGYALRHAEHADTMTCVGRIDAGADVHITAPAGACVAIATGARVPNGLDTIVQHEWTRTTDKSITFQRMADIGSNIHLQGADAIAGTQLLPKATMLDTVALGLASACGETSLHVRRHPTVAVCTSGDEVVAATDTPAAHQIRNSNGPMIASLVRRLGAMVQSTTHLRDDADAVLAPLADLVAPADIIVTTGGISEGQRDVIAAAFDDLGVTWTIIGATVKPGRPIRLGMLGETIVVCLPGNPVSALVMGSLVLSRICEAMLGRAPKPWTPTPLVEAVNPNPRRTLIRPCHVMNGAICIPTWQGSGDLVHAAGTHGVVRVPMQDEPIPAGALLPFCPWP